MFSLIILPLRVAGALALKETVGVGRSTTRSSDGVDHRHYCRLLMAKALQVIQELNNDQVL